MTFNKSAWAINGATVDAALARNETYAATQGSEGIVQKDDLKVTALAVPGNGIQISAGAALVLNRYQSPSPDQTYVISNPTTHTVSSSEMPSSNAAAKEYLVFAVVGDKDFSQTDHPFMLATDPPLGQEATFSYVRPVVYGPVTAGATRESIAKKFPGVLLARINIPANTTTITQAMITDQRALAQPRTFLAVGNVNAPSANGLNGNGGVPGTFERWPNVAALTVAVPKWAVAAKIFAVVEGARLTKAGSAILRGNVSGTALVTQPTNVNESAPRTGADRVTYNVVGECVVTSVAGTTQTFIVQGTPNDTGSKGALATDSATAVMMQVYFEEQPT